MSKKMHDASRIRLRGETAQEALAGFAEYSSEDLAKLIINDRLNDFMIEYVEYGRVTYHDWFWRPVDFFNPNGVTIARAGDEVGICMRNRWGFPERYLTVEEQTQFLRLVLVAYLEWRKGGAPDGVGDKTRAALDAAGDFIENLEIGEDEQ